MPLPSPGDVPVLVPHPSDVCACVDVGVHTNRRRGYTDVSYMWSDEVMPAGSRGWATPLLDRSYRAYRWVRWGRRRDVECVRIWHGVVGGALSRHDPRARVGAWPASRTAPPPGLLYDVRSAGHDDTTPFESACHARRLIPCARLTRAPMGAGSGTEGRPLLFVRTWNHSLSEMAPQL
jgi:hypothetical protein